MLVTKITGNCPYCGGKGCYGNINVVETQLWQGCSKCSKSVHSYLPEINKKIIYLDQFFFTEAYLGKSGPFIKAADLIKKLSSKQLLVAPFSSIHEKEAHQWVHRHELYEFIKSTSRGHEFEPYYSVQRNQILKGFKSWLANLSDKYEIEESDAFSSNIHIWDSYFRIDVKNYRGDIELIRNITNQSVEELVNIFDDWRLSTNSFEEDVEIEQIAYAKGFIDSYITYINRLAKGDFAASYNSPVMASVVESLTYLLPKTMPREEILTTCMKYLLSDNFRNLPIVTIEAKTFAMLKSMVKGGAYTNRKKSLIKLRGFFNDVRHISTYAPYCDAFIMDKPMASIMTNPNLALEKNYNVKVFSRNNWGELLTWLEEIDSNASQEHLNTLSLAY